MLRDLGVVCLFLLIWVLFQVLDPFSTESATRNASQNFLSAVSAPFYGMTDHPARDQVAVVEITDSTLAPENLNHAWPLPYSTLALYLDEILDASPKAVFVDIVFSREQEGQSLDDFSDVLRKARDKNILLLFAGGEAGHPLPAPLTDYATVARWEAEPGFYPLVQQTGGEDGSKLLSTASFDLYARLCKTNRLAHCADLGADDVLDRPIFVRWGAALPPEQRQVSQTETCWQYGPGTWRGLLHAGWLMVGELLPGLRIDATQLCFYELTVSAEQLHRAGANREPVAGLLSGRVVFFGADLAGDHDVVPAAAYGLITGTQLHAMAFDNLLTYGAGYFQQPKTLRLGRHLELSPVELGLGLLAWFAGLLLLALGHANRTRIGKAILVVLLAAAAVDFSQRWLDGSTLGWSVVAFLYAAAVLLAAFAWIYEPKSRRTWLARRWSLAYGVLAKVAKAATLVASLIIVNELLLHWPVSDWFGLVLLFAAIGETRQATKRRIAEDEKRLVDYALESVCRISDGMRGTGDRARPAPDAHRGD